MRTFITSIIVFLLLAGGSIWLLKNKPTSSDSSTTEPTPAPDPTTYAVTVADIQLHRDKLAQQYQEAQTDQERDQVVASARSLLELTMPSLMNCWLGTPWDFNGTVSTPGGGKIACGYFVSTIMRDAGFDVQRINLAQQASQNIIRTFLPREALQIKTNTDYADYMDLVREQPHGIYIIGLDKHVGFLVHNDKGLRFQHSGGLLRRVVSQSQADAYAIEHSNYRVIGNITASDEVIMKWLKKKPFPTHR